MNKSIVKKIIKFVMGGFLGYLINFGITVTLTDLLGIYYLLSYVIGLTVSIFFNFIFAIKIIFKVKNDYKRRFLIYILFVTLFFILNIFNVHLFTETFKFNYKISIILVTGIMWIIKYSIYDKIVFKVDTNEPQNTRDSIT